MSFFMRLLNSLRGNKAKTEQVSDSWWLQAHRATPQAYEQEDGSKFLLFTLTEDTDTILPLAPRKQYQIDGETPENIYLGLFSLTEDRSLGKYPYDDCIGELKQIAVEIREQNILVSGMSLLEMRLFIDKVASVGQTDGD